MTETEALGLPFGRALTYDDLAAMPDDGHRYELIDGVLVVSPAPQIRHQRVAGAIYRLLSAAATSESEVFFAPVDLVLAADTVLEPDVVVLPRGLEGPAHRGVPLLAVEVLSPSTRRIDLVLKRSRLEAAGCPAYWIVDPDGPSVTALELRKGRLEQVAEAFGEESMALDLPFPVTIVPARLLE